MITTTSSPIKGRRRGNYRSRTIFKYFLLLVTTTGLTSGPRLYRENLQHGFLDGFLCEGLLLGPQHSVSSISSSGRHLVYGHLNPRSRTILLLDGDGADDGSDDEATNFDAENLSKRIQQLKDSESEASDKFTSGLEQRVRELRSAKAIEEKFDGDDQDSLSSLLSLPVICFDAILPNQKLEGSTEDPTFIRFLLEETGLGGWFIMTSLEYRSRKVRRNGVLCKVEFLDAAASLNNFKTRLPTSVDFVIVGKRRCRLAGKKKGLESRIGRWRRIYDENGEESVLGWGLERFTDELPPSDDSDRVLESSLPEEQTEAQTVVDPKVWTSVNIEVQKLDEGESLSDIDPASLDKAESLIPLLEEWCDLVSNPDTYRNTNVTASIRAQRNQPVLHVDPEALLKRVIAELGERPNPRTDPTGFCFWGGALINPLPALGVSLEIRGNLLEVRTLEERLTILEAGLVRSIQNLKGERRL